MTATLWYFVYGSNLERATFLGRRRMAPRATRIGVLFGRPERKPSRRYLGLLLAGACELGLPPAWIARLRAWPLAVDERERQPTLL